MKTFLEESVSEILSTPSNLESLIIVLPSRRAGVFFKEALVSQLTKPSLAPKIFSVEEFIQEISTLKLVPTTSALITFFEIYSKLTPKKYLDTFEEFIQWAPPLLKDFSDIDSYLVNSKNAFDDLIEYHAVGSILEEDSSYEKQQHFWNSLELYFNEHKKSLLSNGLGTLGMLYREAVDSVEIYIENTSQQHYFIGFNALNKAESTLFQAFLEQDRATMFWDLDDFFYEYPEHAAGRFIKKHLKEWTYYRQRKHVKFPSNFEKSKTINIVGIPKNIGQAKYAASLLKENVKSQRSLSKTALVLGNESILIPVLSGLPNEVEEWNVTMGYPLENTPVSSFFHYVFEMHLKSVNGGYSYDDIIRVTSFDWIQDLLNINSEDCKVLLESLKTSFNSFLGPKELKSFLDHPFGILIFSPFNSVASFVQRISDITLMIQEHIKRINGQQYVLFPTYLTLIEELVQQLLNMGDTLTSVDTLRALRYLWNELINSLSIDYKGNPMGGVQIMGMLETRVLDFDTVILTNLNEGILPKGRSSQSVFSFAMKKTHGLPTFLDNDAIYTYHFYRLLQRATNITLLYNTESDGLNSGEPSRFIHQLRFLKLAQHNIIEKFESASTRVHQSKETLIQKTPAVIDQLHRKAKRGFSPSALVVYLMDPLLFYHEKVLNISKKKSYDNTISLAEGGLVAHKALHKLYMDFIGKTMKESDYIDLSKKVSSTVIDSFHELYGGDKKVSGKIKLTLYALEQSVLKLLKVEQQKVKEGNSITILGLEKKFNHTIEIDGIGPVVLNGEIDRIDRYNGVLRIIDYKSGAIDPNKLIFSDLNEINGDKKRRALFQLLFYCYSFKEEIKHEKQVTAGIICFKNMERYLLPLGKKIKGVKEPDLFLTEEGILSFESYLIDTIKEIFDISKPFASLED